MLDANAFFWLAARERLKPACVWATLGALACIWAWGLARFHREWLFEGPYLLTGLTLNLLLKGWVASEAGRQLAEDRKSGALELLLSTSITVREILRGQSLALKRQFLGPLVLVLLVGGIFMCCDTGTIDEEKPFWLCLWGGGMVMLVADLTALYWVGLWQGLTAKNPNRAVSGTVGCVLALPNVAFALVALVVSLIWTGGRPEPTWQPTWRFFVGLWLGLGLAADFGFGAWARHKLLSEFRLAATERYASGKGFSKRLRSQSNASVTAGLLPLPPEGGVPARDGTPPSGGSGPDPRYD